MRNAFAEEYRIYRNIEAAYDRARDEKDEAGLEQARAEMRAFRESLLAKGTDYEELFTAYKDAKKRGNEYIDIDWSIWDENVKATIDRLRNFGIERFTFSSGWSSAVETAWLFLQNGCTLEGMAEINDRSTSFGRDELDKKHAYVFSIH
ncbi:MAG: hypothetical protein LUC41_03445 [Clostridiales bacterium]|nr:hypothetical protein [Clostridiales bacterium]